MQNPPLLRDGLENADLFPMSGPASWCFLIPKRFCKEVFFFVFIVNSLQQGLE